MADKDFRLLETMRVTAPGDVFLLHRHLERLRASAAYFSFTCDIEKIREAIVRAGERGAGAMRLRLSLSADGRFELDFSPMPESNPKFVRVAPICVDSKDPFLQHKTTRRELYDEAHRKCGPDTDVILVNERGEITETTIANIAVLRDGRWLTPPSTCGLLPGVLRAELLATGEIVEARIRADELRAGEDIRCFNALRGIFESKLKDM